MNKPYVALSVLAATCLLAACGGGGGNDSPPEPVAPPSTSVPASVWASVMAYFNFTGSLVATESGLPLGVDEVQPPTSETALPSPVN